MCFYENRLFLFESLERRAARDLIVPETGEDIDGCVRGFVCVLEVLVKLNQRTTHTTKTVRLVLDEKLIRMQ